MLGPIVFFPASFTLTTVRLGYLRVQSGQDGGSRGRLGSEVTGHMPWRGCLMAWPHALMAL
jgi:hypothetical protein